MNDQSGGENPATPSDPAKPDSVDRGVAKFKRYFQERRANKKKQTPADRAALSTARATWAIAFFTLVTVGIGVSHYFAFHGQLTVMQATLTEMKNSAPQTAELVEANKKLAQATADMAATSKSNLEATGAIAGRQLRAKISIPSAELESFEVGTAPNAFVQIENTGQGTANGKMRGIVKIASVTDSRFPIDRKTISASVTAQPNAKNFRTIQSFHRLTEEQMRAVMTGKSAIIAYGDYRFTDESRTVTYCVYRLFYRGGGANISGVGGPWMPAPATTVIKPPVLRPTAGYNHCDEEKAPPTKSSE